MKIFIIGRGSMAQRRIRNLEQLGYNEYTTWDITDDISAMDSIKDYKPDYILVCSPPLTKEKYIRIGNDLNIPVFCEADITAYNGYYYPSATYRFNQAVKLIKEKLSLLGKVYHFTYHMGQDIRTWHPGTDLKTYYAAQKNTGACKEMFCFELSWLMDIFGTPEVASVCVDKLMDIPDVTADDLYTSIVLFGEKPAPSCCYAVDEIKYKSKVSTTRIFGNITIDIISKPATRELKIIGENGIIKWSWENDYIEFLNDKESEKFYYEKGRSAKGYNQNISEQMYVDELEHFFNATDYSALLIGNRKVIRCLDQIEKGE